MIRFVLLAALMIIASVTTSEAKSHRKTSVCVETGDILRPTCGYNNFLQPVQNMYAGIGHAVTAIAERIVEHPPGCPRSAFCGCGASIEIFGHPVRSLFLAANWYRFPRTQPAPNTAAVRPHHVFVLKQHVKGPIWLVYDANSGHHLTRVHERSIEGYTIVKPI